MAQTGMTGAALSGEYICPECFVRLPLGDVLLADLDSKLPMGADARRMTHCREIYFEGSERDGKFYTKEGGVLPAFALSDWRSLSGEERGSSVEGKISEAHENVCPRCHSLRQKILCGVRPTQVLGNCPALLQTLRDWRNTEKDSWFVQLGIGSEEPDQWQHVRSDWNYHFLCRRSRGKQWLTVKCNGITTGSYYKELFVRECCESEAVLFLLKLEPPRPGMDFSEDAGCCQVLQALEESLPVREAMREKCAAALLVLPEGEDGSWEERHHVLLEKLQDRMKECRTIPMREEELADPEQCSRRLRQALDCLAEMTGVTEKKEQA